MVTDAQRVEKGAGALVRRGRRSAHARGRSGIGGGLVEATGADKRLHGVCARVVCLCANIRWRECVHV